MDVLIQQILNGLVVGCVYAVIALGYTMVYGILGIINFAHGDVLMVGALSALSVAQFIYKYFPTCSPSLIFILTVMFAMLVSGSVSFLVERLAYRPLRNAPRLAPLITAIGVSILLQTIAMLVWGRNPLSFPQLLSDEVFHITDQVMVTKKELVIIATAFSMMGGLTLLVHKTRLGRAMRAISESPQNASLMGVNPDYVIATTFVIGAAMAAVAGTLMACNYGSAHFYMGFLPGIKAFTAAVLGGIGSLFGAMVGGILLGLIEVLGASYIGNLTGGVFGSNYQDIFAFIVLILVLVFRPSGIMGERVADRA